MKKITALIIMDGYGLSPVLKGNAVGPHCSPYVRYLISNYPHGKLAASGLAVGLPEGQMGNSEVGHLNLGAGRVVYQDLSRITNSIEKGDFFDNEALVSAIEKAKSGGKLHLMGLLSDGGVHSHFSHLLALIDLANSHGVAAYVHCFTDGRDVPPKSGIDYVRSLEAELVGRNGKIATVSGRYYAMDRDNRWDRIEKAYDAMVLGKGAENADPIAAMYDGYSSGVTDEFIVPTVITEDGAPVATVEDGDTVIFFNFRPDRARQLTRVFTQDNFDGFSLEGKKRSVNWVCMTEYDASFKNVSVAFPPERLDNTLGSYLAANGMTQLHIAETEKYAHVTFFFNGGVEKPNKGETRILINSPKVATYDLKPEMSAFEVTSRAIAEINKEKYDFMVLNFANCDMVGHTGVFGAAKKAVATVDECVRQIVERVLQQDGTVFVTADHGNAEKMSDENGQPFTAHTTNLVPFVMVARNVSGITLKDGALCDVAPTILDAMNLKKPDEMTGKSLITRKTVKKKSVSKKRLSNAD